MITTSYSPRATLKSVCLMCGLTLFSGYVLSEDSPEFDPMTPLAEEYVHLGLLMQNYDKLEYLYIGSEDWRSMAREKQVSMPQIQAQLSSLQARINTLPVPADAADQDRRAVLLQRIAAMITRLDILQGNFPASFDEETRLVFGVEAPHYDEDHFRALAVELDELIPGEGDLPPRVNRFRDQFIIPADKVEAVITESIAECRRRTRAHIDLPDDESVTLNITTGKHWVGFAEFQGNSHTVVHINREVPIHVERVIQLGCHEAYPGHHVHAALMEAELVKKRGWIEYSYIPLHGSLAVIAEGAANYGVDLAFTLEERVEYERSVILPMAGLDGEQLELYYRYFELLDQLNFARNEVARHYLYNGMPREQAIEWLMEFGLESRGTASQRIDFIEAMRAYVINYNYGKTLVREYVESQAGPDRNARWQVFKEVLSTPISPVKMLRKTAMSEAE